MILEAELYQAFDSEPTSVVKFLHWLTEKHNLQSPPSVLDVGCGPGRILRPLAELGWQVVGLEPDFAFCNYAKQESLQYPNAMVRQGGFNDILEENKYDLICGINSSFAYVLTPEARLDALKRAFRALRIGGLLFLDLPNLLCILKEYRGPGKFKATVGDRPVTLIRHHEVDYHHATFTTKEEYSFTNEQGIQQCVLQEHSYAITSYPELSYLLSIAGFKTQETYRSYSTRNEESLVQGRMMIVAVKSLGSTGSEGVDVPGTDQAVFR